MRRTDPRQLQLLFDTPEPETPSAAPIRTTPKILRLPTANGTSSAAPPDAGKHDNPGARRSLAVGGQTVNYLLRRSKRRTVGFLIDGEGLRVTAPRWLTIAAVEESIREKQRWILPRLDKLRERLANPSPASMVWQDGTALPFMGGNLNLRLLRGDAEAAHHADNELLLTVPDFTTELHVKELVRDWLQTEALRVFAERLPIYAAGLGVECKGLALSSAAARWGSCSPSGKIRLNWRLIHFPLLLIDYVIAHELAHLREMNHGPRFWAAVASVFPEHAQARKALSAQAQAVMALF